ncbi:MAG: transporter related protein [Herbaspirillum sp.]|nr:transporter related protein [Herbaspirillum sp.]
MLPADSSASSASSTAAANSSDIVIELDEIGKTFGTGRSTYAALARCSLRVVRGEFLCLLGPSGCGKSTLLNLLAGFEAPTSGAISFDGMPLVGHSSRRVMCFQDSMQALLPWATVADNIRFVLKLRGVPRSERDARIAECLDIVGLAAYAERYPTELSGGMRQRVQIGRSLAADPDVLLMDEPFGALDAMTRAQMQLELLRVWEKTKKTIVFITHDIDEALLLGDRICVMNRGPGSHIVREFSVKSERPRRMQDPGVAEIADQIRATFAALGEAGAMAPAPAPAPVM